MCQVENQKNWKKRFEKNNLEFYKYVKKMNK